MMYGHRQNTLQIVRSKLPEEMRFKILDFIRSATQRRLNEQETAKYLKIKIQQQYEVKSKWQIILTQKQIFSHFDDALFPFFLEAQNKGHTYLIFSRGQIQRKRQKTPMGVQNKAQEPPSFFKSKQQESQE